MVGLFEDEQPFTSVVNIKHEVCDIYIGRGSVWGNPFSHLPKSTAKWKVANREEAIDRYREYILTRPDLLARLGELRGQILGCWCKPKSCHGDILVELIQALYDGNDNEEKTPTTSAPSKN